MSQFEYGDYYKFVVSCGVALIIVAAGLPWLFLHEPFDLLVESSKLAGLTPLARRIVTRRQETVFVILAIIPYASSALLAGGTFMTTYGLVTWRRRQRVRDTGEDTDVNKKLFEFRQMTQAEVDAKALGEITAQHSGVLLSPAESSSSPIDTAVADYLDSENLFLDVLEARLPAGYKLKRHQQSLSYKFDALLLPETKGAPEYLIEFKKVSAGTRGSYLVDTAKNLSTAADWAGYGQGTRKIPMLIAVSDLFTPKLLEDIYSLVRISSDNPTAIGRILIRFIGAQRLKSLSARDIDAILNTSERVLVLADDMGSV